MKLLLLDVFIIDKLKSLGLMCLLFISFHDLSAEVVGQSVYEKLSSQQKVRVIVILESTDSKFVDLNSRIDDISNNKTRILSKLNSLDFEILQNWVTINAFSGLATIDAIEKLSLDPGILKIDLDTGGNGGLFQSVPLISSNDVIAAGFTGRGVTVAVLDTGIDTESSNLEDDLVTEQCFCEKVNGSGCCPNGAVAQSGNGSAEDDNGHGTNVSGIITSNGIFPAPEGVAPDAGIVAVKVLDEDNSFSNTSQIISGLEWILMNRPDVRVINMSLGTKTLFNDECDDQTAFTIAFFDVVQNLVDSDVVVFASSQNDESINSIAAPACLSNTVSVGAVFDGDNGTVEVFDCKDNGTEADKVACFSNSSANLDLLAPGCRITSTGNRIGISTLCGTSQACAHASASAALLLDADPTLTPDEIKQTLIDTGVLVIDERNGMAFPRINALAAFNFVTGMNIQDSGSGSTSLCSIGGKVSYMQFIVIILIYMIPLLFILIRKVRSSM